MVVLFLMGLIMMIAMPYLGSVTDSQLKSASRRLAGRATYLYDEAMARKLVIRLVYDIDKDAYFVTMADPYAPQPAFYPDLSTAGRRVQLPDNVRIRDVSVEGVGTMGKGQISTQFYPQGFADGTVIHLIDRRQRVMTLKIDSLTGHVAIAMGDFGAANSNSLWINGAR